MIKTQRTVISFLILFFLIAFALLAAGTTAIAVPGAETREDAFAELAERQAAGAELSDEELEALEAARSAEAVAAITAEGVAPLQAMWVYLFEDAGFDAEEPRTTVTVTGAIDPYTPLPAKVMFYFGDDYELNMLEQLDFDTGESLGELEYVSGPSALDDFENLTTYTFSLTEGHVFNAGFEIPLALFDPEMAMGDSPLAAFTFVPPNDLYGLVVGIVSPSPDLVGAGGQEAAVLIGETDEGEIYGIVREDVPGGELQEYLIAFGSREARDAALAAAAETAEETTPTAMGRVGDWFSSPAGMIIAGSALVLLIALVLVVILVARQRRIGEYDELDEGNEGLDDELDETVSDDGEVEAESDGTTEEQG
ncbi:MAG: hypothetical protein FWE48_05595 [Coriobacteriia bacterium]|nr:hypothetical protein [Coriobacteriia bacterium]